MSGELYWRQLALYDPSKHKVAVTLIGCGGLGSHIALTLAKMGIQRLILWDHDSVELHNLPNQMFRPKDINKPKVIAVADIIGEFMQPGPILELHAEKYLDQPLGTDLVISALDSLEARRLIFQAVKTQTPHYYIDCRMGGTIGVIYGLDPAVRNEKYEQSMEGEGADMPCTARSIIFNVLFVSATVASMIRNQVIGQENPFKVVMSSDIPYLARVET